MPQGKSSHVKITTVTLPQHSYAGYWAGLTYHRGVPLPLSPLSERWRIRMQGETDAFLLLRGEGNVLHQYLTDYEDFTLNNQNAAGQINHEGLGMNFYAVAPSTAAADVNVNIIEEK